MRSIASIVLSIGSWVLVPGALLYWLIVLVARARRLRKVRHVVLPELAKNYGYTITTPDMARRIWPNDAAYILSWEVHGTQNPRVADIWPDIDVFAVRRPALYFELFGKPVRLPRHVDLEPIAFRVTTWFMRLLNPAATVHDLDSLDRAAETFLSAKRELPARPAGDKLDAFYSNLLWGLMQTETQAGRIELPASERRDILRKIRAISGQENPRLCALHLRKDALNPAHPRDGSGVDAWTRAIDLIKQRGFTILGSGDEIPTAPGDAVITADDLGLTVDTFRVFAVTSAEVFIGDMGGGAAPPVINKTPTLLFNAFPIASCLPVAWSYPKRMTLRGESDTDLETVLTRHPHAPFVHGSDAVEVFPIPADEIAESVAWFLDGLEDGSLDDVPHSAREEWVWSLLPDHAIARGTKARLVPRYVDMLDQATPDAAE